MKRLVQILAVSAFIAGMVVVAAQPVSGQAAGKLVMSTDLALFAGPNQPRNCFTMNRFKPGEPAGFRVSVIDGATGQPAADAEVVVHLTYGGKREDVPARYRGTPGRGAVIPNLWTAKWMVPKDAPTGTVQVTVTAKDKSGRMAEWKPYPNVASHLTIINE
jgi:hypothetical protein